MAPTLHAPTLEPETATFRDVPPPERLAAPSGPEPMPAAPVSIGPGESPLARAIGRCRRPVLVLATFVLLALVGTADYLSGYKISVLIFYLLPVSLAAWFVGRGFGVAMSLLSAAVALSSDVAAGAVYSSMIIPAWNVAISLGFFLVVTWLLSSLRAVLLELEIRVRQRTIALTEEMAGRERLEKDVLEISEREQRRIGHDLHDGLGQHLTGTALAGQVLAERLAARELPESDDAERIVGLIEDAIELTRSLARGLSPVAMDAEGLSVALTELAAQTTAQFYLPCAFRSAAPVQLADPPTATHLYRIAQEAVGNAIRHGRPSRLDITLAEDPAGRVTLTVRDDGRGLPPAAARHGEGLGLRTMAHRARMIGATLDVRAGTDRGTVVECTFSKPPATLAPATTDHDRYPDLA